MFNSCTFVGNLTKDPELRYTGTGKAVSSFTVAVNSIKKEADPLYIECSAWEKQAETLAQNLVKGSKVLINGRMTQQRWEDKEGQRRSKYVLELRDCEFLSPKKNGDSQAQTPATDDGGDVPF